MKHIKSQTTSWHLSGPKLYINNDLIAIQNYQFILNSIEEKKGQRRSEANGQRKQTITVRKKGRRNLKNKGDSEEK